MTPASERRVSPGESAARAGRRLIAEKLETDAIVMALRSAFTGPFSREKLYQARTAMRAMSKRQA